MSLIKGNIKKALSQWILLPYHFYVRLKKIPGLFKNLSLSKPTNKEFVQEYNTWLKRKSRMGLSSLSSLEGRNWLPKLGVLIVVSSDSVEYLKGTLEAVRDSEYESKDIVLGLNVSNREEAQKLRSVCEICLQLFGELVGATLESAQNHVVIMLESIWNPLGLENVWSHFGGSSSGPCWDHLESFRNEAIINWELFWDHMASIMGTIKAYFWNQLESV